MRAECNATEPWMDRETGGCVVRGTRHITMSASLTTQIIYTPICVYTGYVRYALTDKYGNISDVMGKVGQLHA